MRCIENKSRFCYSEKTLVSEAILSFLLLIIRNKRIGLIQTKICTVLDDYFFSFQVLYSSRWKQKFVQIIWYIYIISHDF